MCDCSRGPVSTMPGSVHSFPPGTMCDQHPDTPAIIRIQGETDSIGCEYADMCKECHELYASQLPDPNAGRCDWCGYFTDQRLKTRDYDEGSCGPLYDVCTSCRDAARQRAADELAEIAEDYPNIDDDWPEPPDIIDPHDIRIDD